MSKRSQYGKSQQEASWRATEVDVIYRLRDAGVRVPEPRAYVDDVLVMELVTDEEGNPAPRLADVSLQRTQAEELFKGLLDDVKKMLCAGLVHGDLSEFNVLVGTRELVIIDFPQAVDSASNQNARRLLIRDIGNLSRFLGRFNRKLRFHQYGEEMWDLYERGQLTADTPLTGRFRRAKETVEVSSLLAEIAEMEQENRARREALGLPPPRPARQPRPEATETPSDTKERPPGKSRRRRRRKPTDKKAAASSNTQETGQRQQREPAKPTAKSSDPTKPRRRRRSRRRPQSR